MYIYIHTYIHIYIYIFMHFMSLGFRAYGRASLKLEERANTGVPSLLLRGLRLEEQVRCRARVRPIPGVGIRV